MGVAKKRPNFVRPRLGYVWYLTETIAVFALAFVLCFFYFRPMMAGSEQGGFDLWDAAVTVVATFLGATLAFFSEAFRSRSQRISTQRTAAHLAFFKLRGMIERIENIRRQYVNPHRADAARILNMPASLRIDPKHPQLDFDSLAFMLDRHSDILGELWVAQSRFESFIELFNERSACHQERIQPKLKEHEIPGNFEASEETIIKLLGFGNFQEITNLTSQVIQVADEDVASLTEVANRFGIALVEYFPDWHPRIELIPEKANA